VSQRAINTASINNGNVNSVEADNNNNNNNNSNNGQTASSLHQLLYSSNEEYPPTSTAANHVSSSQQGSELNEDCRCAIKCQLRPSTISDQTLNSESVRNRVTDIALLLRGVLVRFLMFCSKLKAGFPRLSFKFTSTFKVLILFHTNIARRFQRESFDFDATNASV
jgi:hypothetical protein